MTTAVANNIQAQTPPAPAAQQQQAPASPAATTNPITAAVQAAAQEGGPLDNDTSISPRIVVDPSAGVIIQFLSNTGVVQNQIPSSTVVAYLRAGLTADGLSKPQTTGASA